VNLIRAPTALALPSRANILNAIETLVIGAAGGLLFLWANLPGGLISGAMIAVGIAALAGRPLAVPPILTQTVLLLLGISLGSLVSRQLIQHMSSYPLTIGLLALATFCSTFGSSFYLQRVHGWDQTSAFLAGSPGALSQITILAAEKGADVAAIAVVQTMRVIILTAALPLVLALTGIAPSAAPAVDPMIASPLELATLIAASVAIALLLRWVKFPASWMFGAMLASSVLHGTGTIEGGLPPWVRGVALVGIGALANAWLGGYHAGVEWGFWQGPTDCSGPVGNLGSAGNLLERLDTVRVIRCDEVQWRFLGLSLAGYNVLISLLMAAITAWGMARTAKS
jgi:hypothetical protein